MQINLYKEHFLANFSLENFASKVDKAIELFSSNEVKRIFFIGNGGSNSICSHMMEDYAKIAGYPTFAFSDASLITCYANDYGYDNAMKEWLKIHLVDGDLLVAISSSGESKNILNAVNYVKENNGKIITLSGFKKENQLFKQGDINFHVDISNYGIVECFHQVILHIILDSINEKR
jgi:D-sedoheptulose 7-phosphate isomerase